MKQHKKEHKNLFKNAINDKDYETMEKCINFINKYDELYGTNKFDKYKKDFKIEDNTLKMLENRYKQKKELEEKLNKLENQKEDIDILKEKIKTLENQIVKNMIGKMNKEDMKLLKENQKEDLEILKEKINKLENQKEDLEILKEKINKLETQRKDIDLLKIKINNLENINYNFDKNIKIKIPIKRTKASSKSIHKSPP